MSEYLKRELAINSEASYPYIESQLLTSFGGVGVRRQTRYQYSGNGIFCPQTLSIVGINPTNYASVTTFTTFTYSVSTDNGKLLLPRQFITQQTRVNLAYDNFDHVPPLTNNDGLVIDIFANTATTIQYWVTLQGMVYLA